MTDERYRALEADPTAKLTVSEQLEGWHWCGDWDGMLVGPGMDGELRCCNCHYEVVVKLRETLDP